MNIYFHNIDKYSSFALNRFFFVVNILFSNNIIKLTEFIKLI